MRYDPASTRYFRYANGVARKDYGTDTPITVKNVFVLLTTISDYPDGYHRKVALQDGTGYYMVNGTYTPILWSKGAASSAITFKNTDGSPLQVNAGKSWICIADQTTSQPIISE